MAFDSFFFMSTRPWNERARKQQQHGPPFLRFPFVSHISSSSLSFRFYFIPPLLRFSSSPSTARSP